MLDWAEQLRRGAIVENVWLRSIHDGTWKEVSLSTSVPQRLRITRQTEAPVWREVSLCQLIIDEIRERR